MATYTYFVDPVSRCLLIENEYRRMLANEFFCTEFFQLPAPTHNQDSPALGGIKVELGWIAGLPGGRFPKVSDYVEHAIRDNLDPEDFTDQYDDFLDEYSQGDLQGMFKGYSPSSVLKQIDETAYRCGYGDYLDALTDDNGPAIYLLGDYYNREKVHETANEALDHFRDLVSDLEDKLADAEEIRDELYNDPNATQEAQDQAAEQVEEIEAEIERLQDEIEDAERDLDL